MDRSNDETGFNVYRGARADNVTDLVATTAADLVEFDDTGLRPGTTYHYRVHSYNGHGESPFDSYSLARTPLQEPPIIVLSDSTPELLGVLNVPYPKPRSVIISSDGETAVTGLDVTVDYIGRSGWLAADLAGTTAPTRLSLSVDMSDIEAGTFEARLTITSPTAANSPLTVPVTLNVAYELIELPGLGGIGSRAIDINSAGLIVGWSDTPAGLWRPVLWDGGEAIDVGPSGGYYQGDIAINDVGQIVCGIGSSVFVWEDGQSRAVDGLSSAYWMDINDAGYVVANDRIGSISLSGSFRLGSIGGRETEAAALNNVGQVVGRGTTFADELRAFLWRAGAMTNLGALGGRWSVAEDINDSGVIVGCSGGRPVYWSASLLTELPAPAGRPACTLGINESGQMVGYVTSPWDGHYAAVWDAGRLMLLEPQGAHASSINDSGTIVGYVTDAQDHSDRAVLWRPVP